MSENDINTKKWQKIIRNYKKKYNLTDSLIETIGIQVAKQYKQLIYEGKKQIDEYISTVPRDSLLEHIESYEGIKSFSKIDAGSVFSGTALGSKLWTIPLIAGGITAATSTILTPIGLLLGAGGLIEGFRSLKRRKSVEMLLEDLKPIIKEKLLKDLSDYVRASLNT
jgi:hypothetical protein